MAGGYPGSIVAPQESLHLLHALAERVAQAVVEHGTLSTRYTRE